MSAAKPKTDDAPDTTGGEQRPPADTGDESTPAPKGPSEEEVLARVQKARADEKAKVRKDLDDAKARAEAEKQARIEAEQKAEAAARKLREAQDQSSTDSERLARRLDDLESRTEDLQREKDQLARLSEQRVAELELKLYRERRLRESGVRLSELVVGKTPEEIDAAIETVKEREAELQATIREQLRDEIAQELGATLPRTSQRGGGTSEDEGEDPERVRLSPMDRDEMSKLPPDEYRKRRKALMEQAQKSVPAAYRR